MSAANRREQAVDRTEPVTVTLASGETVQMAYRKAVGLISLGRAQWAEKPKRAKKKSNVSTPDGSAVQEGALAGNKPPSGDSPGDVA